MALSIDMVNFGGKLRVLEEVEEILKEQILAE
jgi:hypothetical protein